MSARGRVNDMPYTSVAAVEDGVGAGKLVLQDPGIELLAPVVEGSRAT